MLHFRLLASSALLLAMLCAPVWGGQGLAPQVAVAGIEQQLLLDLGDGRLDRFSLLEASVIASGAATHDEVAALQDRFTQCCDTLDAARRQREAIDARTLFHALHQRILTGRYDARVTSVVQTLRSGDYNCLTATALYVALCDRFGAPVEIVSTSGHIYCRAVGREKFDIETTCRSFLELSSQEQQRLQAKLRSAGLRVIDRRQLLGKLYYNRGLQLLEAKQFAVAIPLIERSLGLDPNDTDARDNLLAGLNNWALARCGAGEYPQALQLLNEGRRLDSSYTPISANVLHVYQQWANQLCDRRQFSDAISLLEQGRQLHPSASLFSEGPLAIYRAWMRSLLAAGQVGEAERLLNEIESSFGRDAAESIRGQPQISN